MRVALTEDTLDAPTTTRTTPRGASAPTLEDAPALADATTLMNAHRGIVFRLATAISTRYTLSAFFRSLVNFGIEGLEDAVMRFDRGRGVRFVTFAWYRVRGAILDGARRMGWLTRKSVAKDERSPDATPTQERVCNANTHKGWRQDRALTDDPAWQRSDEPPAQADERSPELLLQRAQRNHQVRRAVAALAEPQRTLVRRSYLDGERMEDVASALGMSPSWASRVRKAALQRLALHLCELAPCAA